MENIEIKKADFLRRFAVSKKRKQELLDSMKKELQQEHKSVTGFTATKIFLM